MNDFISRQAAIDAIQKLNIPEDMCVFEIISHIEVEIATLPPVQPDHNAEVSKMEIIHCKDCKFYGRADKRRFYRGSDCLNKRIDTIVPDRDFCSRAERRGEAG